MKGKSLRSMYEKTKNFIIGIRYGRQGLSPKVVKIINEIGDAEILSIEIGRQPVQALITGIIKIVSSTPYDTLFHLFMILHTTKGKVLIEKNSVINMDIGHSIHDNGERIQVPNVPSHLTVNQLVENTKNRMGDKFIRYSAADNNCQDFLQNVLLANGMNDPTVMAFVKQDTTSIFKTHPQFRKFVDDVTDLAGRADVIKQGGKLKGKIISNELSNFEIDRILLHYNIPYHGCFIKDQLPRKLLDGFYIINLNGNSHWTGLCKSGKQYYYYDSYGFPAPQEVEDKIPKEYIWSDKDIQTLASSTCGFYVIAFIRCMYHSKDKMKAYRDYINLFGINKKSNEKVLSSFL